MNTRLTNAPHRKLKRDKSEFRDSRLFIIACDDTYAPDQYFGFFKLPRVQVKVIPTTNGDSHASHVLKRLLEHSREDDDEFWMLLDTDHCTKTNHISSFTEALSNARKSNVNVAISNSCFEVWLLLHHLDETEVEKLETASDIEGALRTALKGQYSKKNLLANDFPLSLVPIACERAKKLDQKDSGEDIPTITTSRVYLLWHSILLKSVAQQLPDELLPLFTSLKSPTSTAN